MTGKIFPSLTTSSKFRKYNFQKIFFFRRKSGNTQIYDEDKNKQTKQPNNCREENVIFKRNRIGKNAGRTDETDLVNVKQW